MPVADGQIFGKKVVVFFPAPENEWPLMLKYAGRLSSPLV